LVSHLYLTPKSIEISDLTDGVRIYEILRHKKSLNKKYHFIYARNTTNNKNDGIKKFKTNPKC